MDVQKKKHINNLVLRIKTGDLSAIEELYYLIGGNIRSIAKRYFSEEFEIDDIVQTFWSKVPELAGKISFFDNAYGYLVKSFENIIRKQLNINNALPIPTDYEAFFWENRYYQETDYDLLAIKEAFAKAIVKMSKRERDVFCLIVYEEKTIRAVAKILGLPRSTVHRLHKKGIEILTEVLVEENII